MKRIYIESDQPLDLNLPLEDRELISDIFFSDIKTQEKIENTDPNDPRVQLTLEDLDLIAGDIAMEANHCKSRKRQKKLDGICDRIKWLLERYTDDKAEVMPEVSDDPYERLVAMMKHSGLGGIAEYISEDFKNKLRLEMNLAAGKISREDYLKQTSKTVINQTDTIPLKMTQRQRSAVLEHLKLSDSLVKRLQDQPIRKSLIQMTPSELNDLRDYLEGFLGTTKCKQEPMLRNVLRSVNECYEQYITVEFTIDKGIFRF